MPEFDQKADDLIIDCKAFVKHLQEKGMTDEEIFGGVLGYIISEGVQTFGHRIIENTINDCLGKMKPQ